VILTAASTAGKEQGIAVQVIVPLLRTSDKAEDKSSGSADLNILGETNSVYAARRKSLPTGPAYLVPVAPPGTDWRNPNAAETKTALIAWLTDLARTPGLTGIVLRDTAAPGYTSREGAGGIRESAAANDFGYTPEMRLAFLRQEGYDPIDLGGGAIVALDLTLPFFPDAGPPTFLMLDGSDATGNPAEAALKKWNTFRYKVGATLLADVYAALHAATPDLPLSIAARPVPFFSTGPLTWFGSWDAPDRLPYPTPPGDGEPRASLSQQARSFSKRVLLSLPYPSPNAFTEQKLTTADYARHLTPLLQKNSAGWDGVVLDLSGIPTERALVLLGGVAAPKSRLVQDAP
jgi:hypothetical protein